MTTEKAINILTTEKEYHILQLTTSNDNHYDKIQALDMAIKGLQALCTNGCEYCEYTECPLA